MSVWVYFLLGYHHLLILGVWFYKSGAHMFVPLLPSTLFTVKDYLFTCNSWLKALLAVDEYVNNSKKKLLEPRLNGDPLCLLCLKCRWVIIVYSCRAPWCPDFSAHIFPCPPQVIRYINMFEIKLATLKPNKHSNFAEL